MPTAFLLLLLGVTASFAGRCEDEWTTAQCLKKQRKDQCDRKKIREHRCRLTCGIVCHAHNDHPAEHDHDGHHHQPTTPPPPESPSPPPPAPLPPPPPAPGGGYHDTFCPANCIYLDGATAAMASTQGLCVHRENPDDVYCNIVGRHCQCRPMINNQCSSDMRGCLVASSGPIASSPPPPSRPSPPPPQGSGSSASPSPPPHAPRRHAPAPGGYHDTFCPANCIYLDGATAAMASTQGLCVHRRTDDVTATSWAATAGAARV